MVKYLVRIRPSFIYVWGIKIGKNRLVVNRDKLLSLDFRLGILEWVLGKTMTMPLSNGWTILR